MSLPVLDRVGEERVSDEGDLTALIRLVTRLLSEVTKLIIAIGLVVFPQ